MQIKIFVFTKKLFSWCSELCRSAHSHFGEIGINLQEAFDFIFKSCYDDGGSCEKGEVFILVHSLFSESGDGWVDPVLEGQECSRNGIGWFLGSWWFGTDCWFLELTEIHVINYWKCEYNILLPWIKNFNFNYFLKLKLISIAKIQYKYLITVKIGNINWVGILSI